MPRTSLPGNGKGSAPVSGKDPPAEEAAGTQGLAFSVWEL